MTIEKLKSEGISYLKNFGFDVSGVGDNYVEYSKTVLTDTITINKGLYDQYSIKVNRINVFDIPKYDAPFRFYSFGDVVDFLVKYNFMEKLPLIPTECNQTPFTRQISGVKIEGDKFFMDDDFFGDILKIDQTEPNIVKIAVKRISPNTYLNGQIHEFTLASIQMSKEDLYKDHIRQKALKKMQDRTLLEYMVEVLQENDSFTEYPMDDENDPTYIEMNIYAEILGLEYNLKRHFELFNRIHIDINGTIYF